MSNAPLTAEKEVSTGHRSNVATLSKRCRVGSANLKAAWQNHVYSLLDEAADEIDEMIKEIKKAHRSVNNEWGGDSSECSCAYCQTETTNE